jgi:hypothetical protein
MLRNRITTSGLLALLALSILAPTAASADGDRGHGDWNGGHGDDGHGDDGDWGQGGYGGGSASAPSIYAADLGRVVAGAVGTTTFRFGPDGSVSRVNGSGARVSGGAVRFQVSIPCQGSCNSKNTQVEIGSAGTPAGRLGPLTNFTVSMGTARLASGPTGSNPIRFTLAPIGNHRTATFYVGADAAVYGSDSSKPTGPANAPIYVTTRNWKGGGAATSGAALTANVFRGLSVSQTTALNFGTIVRPTGLLAGVILPASTGDIQVYGTAALSSDPPARGRFTVTGEGGQAVAISIPLGFSMSNGSDTIPVLLSREGDGNQALSNSIGTAGTFSFYVGGAFALTRATAPGVYTGSYTVNVDYN